MLSAERLGLQNAASLYFICIILVFENCQLQLLRKIAVLRQKLELIFSNKLKIRINSKNITIALKQKNNSLNFLSWQWQWQFGNIIFMKIFQ